MSDQATGGDGSVRWSIDVDNTRDNEFNQHDNGRLHHHGVDKTGQPGDPFTVSIRLPKDFKGSVDDYLAALRDPKSPFGLKPAPHGEHRVYFNLPIERMTHDQIRVSWGNSNHVMHPEKS